MARTDNRAGAVTSPREAASRQILHAAAAQAGLDSTGTTVIRLAENDLWRLPNRVVARIARPGQHQAAAKEIAVTRWLATHRFPAVRPLPIPQPLQAGGRAVTFWEELPEHRHGTIPQVAHLLRQLHRLPYAALPLAPLDPFVRINERLTAATWCADDDRAWLLNRLAELEAAWAQLPAGLPHCVIHADAWTGNVAATATGPYLLDFERTALGPPEWDLTSTAVLTDTFSILPAREYEAFCEAYGQDVTVWSGYSPMRDIRELRLATFALQAAGDDPDARTEAQYRINCIRGRQGPRPWRWTELH
ncbi:aminoglycoside phosphotransferase family protein [Streptomyces sp. NPDC049577]|uniref:aminoglycoside phosphotransferase family protein n=1 Tax=Streptomyces sp. NPDC049577 TaxID=3155153 RepID=UPI00341317F8